MQTCNYSVPSLKDAYYKTFIRPLFATSAEYKKEDKNTHNMKQVNQNKTRT